MVVLRCFGLPLPLFLLLFTSVLPLTRSDCRCFSRLFRERERDEFSLLLVFASYSNDLAFNVCLKCRNEYKVYNIVCNLMVRCEYVVEVVVVVVVFDVVADFFSLAGRFVFFRIIYSPSLSFAQRVKRRRVYYVGK